METIGPGTGDPLPAGPSAVVQRRRLALSGVRGHVAKGRDFTRQALRDWGWDGTETSEDALLLVSELLTNASLHAGGCVELVVCAGDVLRIEVFDGSKALPRRNPSPQRGLPGGHGLNIVERLSDRWGTHTHEHGKAVWVEIETSRLTSGRPTGR
ncbi:anti-sigma regulatory factor (Ser/Thr protein kinase) [Streptomyces sp. 2132.2]|uniref:ATP-binding protein n=1 Tax=Streptomyces TaxID=1883 RepID=UPI000C1A6457|nr:ATP-binding protein [Streptomyces sp. 2132.2]ROQ94643.1 anti-sigma regulatory factor (Ser/Thr protein kinase) [Streptomyces sp. 2132.2]